MGKLKQCWQELLQIFGLTTKQYWVSLFISFITIILSHIFAFAMTKPDYGFFVFTGIVYICNLPFIPFTHYAFRNKLKSEPLTKGKQIMLMEPQYTYTIFMLAILSPVVFIVILIRYHFKKGNLK